MKQLNNQEKIDLILEDLGRWVDCGDSDCSMAYAYRNGYNLHAASLWLSTGAISESVGSKIEGVTINKTKENKETKQICEEASIYICNECNHHAFLDDNEGKEIDCTSCFDVATLQEGD